jgi:hypothetical protein
MRTRDDIFTELLVRNNLTTTDTFITDTTLKNWFRDAHIWASSYHKWPMTEGRLSTTYTTTEEWTLEGYKADSIRMIQIDGKRLTKLNFEDYQTFREEQPTNDDRVFSTFGKLVYINPYVGLGGTLTAWGQYQPYIDVTDETGVTIFTDWNDEGNEGVLEKMNSYLKRRLGNIEAAELHDQRASAKLEEVWKRYMDEQFKKQTHPDSGGMFKRVDILRGGMSEEIFHRDQF